MKLPSIYKKFMLACAGVLAVLFLALPAIDTYIRGIVNQAISNQIEQRRPEIEAQMQAKIKDAVNHALEDEEVKAQVSVLLQNAVANELEKNGETHIRRIINQKYPTLAGLLDSQQQKQ